MPTSMFINLQKPQSYNVREGSGPDAAVLFANRSGRLRSVLAVWLTKMAVLSDGLILPVRKIAAVMVAAYERSGFGTGTVRPCRS